jgi:hypothetical protein
MAIDAREAPWMPRHPGPDGRERSPCPCAPQDSRRGRLVLDADGATLARTERQKGSVDPIRDQIHTGLCFPRAEAALGGAPRPHGP